MDDKPDLTPPALSAPSASTASAVVVAHLEFKAAMLLLALVLLVGGAIAYLSYARGAFEQTQKLVLVADDSEGVVVGMDLTFAGFPIGRVRGIELAPDGNARIIVDVPVKDAHWLRTSSVFTLVRGVVGNTNIRAFSGVMTDAPLPDGAVRKVLLGDATAEVPRLMAEARQLLQNLNSITAAGSALNSTLGSAQTFTVSHMSKSSVWRKISLKPAIAKKKIAQFRDRIIQPRSESPSYPASSTYFSNGRPAASPIASNPPRSR